MISPRQTQINRLKKLEDKLRDARQKLENDERNEIIHCYKLRQIVDDTKHD